MALDAADLALLESFIGEIADPATTVYDDRLVALGRIEVVGLESLMKRLATMRMSAGTFSATGDVSTDHRSNIEWLDQAVTETAVWLNELGGLNAAAQELVDRALRSEMSDSTYAIDVVASAPRRG